MPPAPTLALLLLLLLLPLTTSLQVKVSRDKTITRLNQYPMIFSHDAGTGYQASEQDSPDPILIFTAAASKCQYGGFVEQIECGARAFDIRPYVKADGSLIFHHGTALCDYPLKDALQEVVDWTTSNPDELVVLSEFSCWSEEGGGDCMDLYKGVLNDLNIYRASSSELMTTIPSSEVDGSDEVAAITVAAAMELASADNPGVNMPLALSSSNIDGTYDTFDYLGECYEMTTLGDYVDFESLLLAEDSSWKPGDKATDFDPAALNKVVNEVTRAVGSIPVGTSCYGSGQNEARRKQREIWDSMAKMGPSEIMKGGARIDPGGNINPTKTHTKPNKPFWKVDGHWQYSTESIVLMFLSASSIVWDSQRSNQNKVVAQWIRHGALSEGASLIGLDHVCSDGRQVYDAIQITLFEEKTLAAGLKQYFSGLVAGIKEGESRYVIPFGMIAAVIACICCTCTQKRCADKDAESLSEGDGEKYDMRKQGGGALGHTKSGEVEAVMMKNGKFGGKCKRMLQPEDSFDEDGTGYNGKL